MPSKKGYKRHERRGADRVTVRGECRPGQHSWRPDSCSDPKTGRLYFFADCWRCGSRVICWAKAPTVTAEHTTFLFEAGALGPGDSEPSEELRGEAERWVREFMASASEREGTSYTVLGGSGSSV
jgi:hypothetical protein